MIKCPLCSGEVTQDYSGDYDIYMCVPCFHYFSPKEVGRKDNEDVHEAI